MKQVRTYILSAEDHYLQFRRAVRNILDWGIDERLGEIRSRLRTLQRGQGVVVKRRMLGEEFSAPGESAVKRLRQGSR